MLRINGKKCVIVRGPSGAGKSTYAKENYPEATICSADLFFEERADLNGTTYEEEFDPRLLSMAHQHCFGDFIHALKVMNDDVILVDNTNTMKWEYENYVLLAELEGYKVEVITVPFDPEMAEVYHERNTHGVLLGDIKDQMARFEH